MRLEKIGIILWVLIVILGISNYFFGYYKGKSDTMRSFQTKECWISEANMDVNCTMYIGDL